MENWTITLVARHMNLASNDVIFQWNIAATSTAPSSLKFQLTLFCFVLFIYFYFIPWTAVVKKFFITAFTC